jgi:hypothetical protein
MDAPPNAPDLRRGPALVALAGALLAAAALRLHHLGALSFYYDELYAVRIHGLSLRNIAGVIARTAFYDIHPPLYYLGTLVWTAALGISEAAARGLSVAAGLATLPVVYLLGRDLHARRTGVLAAALLAVYPVHVYYSREARMYALMAFAASLSTWLLVRLARGDRQRWLLPAWLAATTATALTHYFGVMHVMAEFVILAWRGRRGATSLPAWLALFAAPGAVFVPFALFAQYQTKHNEVSYLGRGLGAYADLFAWLGGGHQHLPLAALWTLPLVSLAALGARASWREKAPDWTTPYAPAPAASTGERALWVLTAIGAMVAAAGVFALRNKVANRIADIEMNRGEVEALAVLQGRTAVVGSFLGGLVGGFAALALAARDGLTARLTKRFPAGGDDGSVDPAGSLVRVSLAVIGTPLAIAVLAGLAGRPLVLTRNFLCATPFVALLAARGLVSLRRPAQGAAAAAVALVALLAASRFGALPPTTLDQGAVRPWLLHTYYDWRRLEGIVRAEREVPILAVQHYATDAAMHYRGNHPVARVRRNAERQLYVSQVRTDDGWDCEFHVGQRFDPQLAPRFFLLDLGALAHDDGASQALLAEARGRHRCTPAGTIPGGVTVLDCRDEIGVAGR